MLDYSKLKLSNILLSAAAKLILFFKKEKEKKTFTVCMELKSLNKFK